MRKWEDLLQNSTCILLYTLSALFTTQIWLNLKFIYLFVLFLTIFSPFLEKEIKYILKHLYCMQFCVLTLPSEYA